MMKRGKKVSLGLLVCLLIFLFGTAVYAADKVRLKVESTSGAVGDQVKVKISIENAGEMAAGQFALHFDSDLVELKEAAAGSILKGKNFTENLSQAGKAIFAWASATESGTASGEICTLTFKLKKKGKTDLEIEDLKISDAATALLEASPADGSISIQEKSAGSGGGSGSGSSASSASPSTGTGSSGSSADTLFQRAVSSKNGAEAIQEGERLVAEAGRILLSAGEVQLTGGKLTVSLGAERLALAADQAVQKAGELNRILTGSGINPSKKLEKILVIEIPAQGAGEVTVAFPGSALDTVKGKGVDRVEIKTEVADFRLTPEILGTRGAGRDLAFTARKGDPPAAGGSPAIDLAVTLGGAGADLDEPLEAALPYTLVSGEKGETVTVFLLNQDGTEEPVGGRYDPERQKVAFFAGRPGTYFAKPAEKIFGDLAQYSWAEQAISNMGGKGIISGRSADRFDPGATVTRAEFAALAGRMLAYEGNAGIRIPFTDVEEKQWYYQAVAAAYQHGLMQGKSADKFDPNGKITRQEMAVIIGNILEKNHYQSGESAQLNAFGDQDRIASWARAAVALAVRENIIQGMEGNRFAPGENANRAQAAVMLYRLYEVMMK